MGAGAPRTAAMGAMPHHRALAPRADRAGSEMKIRGTGSKEGNIKLLDQIKTRIAELKKELHEQAEGLPVDFPGWQDPLPYLAEADVVLCTSRQESWGASIVESLASGVPVVAPDVGVAREAGAIIATPDTYAERVVEVLERGTRGALKMALLSKQEWAKQWEESLK